jgi:hypothetical protein
VTKEVDLEGITEAMSGYDGSVVFRFFETLRVDDDGHVAHAGDSMCLRLSAVRDAVRELRDLRARYAANPDDL